MDSRVDVLERAQATAAPQGERLVRVEEKLEGVTAGVKDIKIGVSDLTKLVLESQGRSSAKVR